MAPVDPGVALAELARACGVPPGQAARAAVALLARRYTGQAAPVVGGHAYDLTEDGPVRELLARPGVPAATGEPAEEQAGSERGLVGGLTVAVGADGRPVVHGCPGELSADFAADLATLIAEMAADPDRSTAGLLPVSAYERRDPVDLAALHGGPRREPLGWEPGERDTICTAFAAQVARHPERPAVLADDGQPSYRQVGAAVAATAAAIRAALGDTVRPGRAALLCRHGATTVTGLLAALVSGRAYVPLEPSYPVPRLAHILADSGADVLLVDAGHEALGRRLAEAAGRPDLALVHIGAARDDVPLDEVLAGLAGPATADDPAYLLYTSGSTGAPKAVVQSHRNVLFGVANHVRNFAITPDDRTSVLTSFGYDMAVTDTFGAILSGAAAVPADIRAHGLGHLSQTLARHGVTIYHSTPTVYRYLVASLGADGRLPGVRAVLLGGEEVTRHDVDLARRHFGPDTVFVNGYGTTEISFATQHHLAPDAPLDHAVVPIGRPLPGVDVALVDAAGRPTCLTGEVVVRCEHVALGYHGLPELTASRFREHQGRRAYWTGDVARRLPDGRLIFTGRADRLVKIRGYRVELGEVEAALAALPGVGHAAVVARSTPAGAGPQVKEIIGYAVAAHGAAPDPSALRASLAGRLPDFMLPRAVVLVDALPMGSTGKLDLRALPEPPSAGGSAGPAPREHPAATGSPEAALPEPAATGSEAPALSSAVTGSPAPTAPPGAPRDPVEQAIADAWCATLGVERVDRDTPFFELGGHSLLLALVQQRLEQTLGRRVPMVALMEFATVAGLAAHLRAGAVPAQRSADVASSRAADRMRRRRQAREAVETPS